MDEQINDANEPNAQPNAQQSAQQNVPPQHLSASDQKPKISKKQIIIIAAVAAGVLLLAVGAFFVFRGGDQTGEPAATQQQSSEEEEAMPAPDAATLDTYTSEGLKLEFTHRRDWTVEESTENKRITVTSPRFTYQTAGGGSTRGVFTLSFSVGASADAKQAINGAKAVKDSLLIAYDAPTEEQRHYTNITYAGPDETSFSFFIVSGSTELKATNPLAGSIVINSGDYLIAGGFGEDIGNRLAYDTVPAMSAETYAAYEQALAIVKSLKVY